MDHGEEHAKGEHVDAFKERSAHLGPQGWWLMPPEERRVFRKLEEAATHRLHELTLTQSGGFQGYSTSADNILVLKLVEDRGDVLLLKPKGGGDPVKIERELVRPWLFGRDVERWHIAWDGWYVLFPYVKIDGLYKLIPSKEYEGGFDYAGKTSWMEDFPKAWSYIKRHVRELRNREGGRFKKGKSEEHLWYGATYPRNLELYEQPKIVLQVSSTSPDAAFDHKGEFVFTAGGTSGVYGLAFDPQHDLWLILALVNSNVLDFYLKHLSTVYAGRSYSYGDQFIKWLPLLVPGLRAKKKRKIAGQLAQLAQKLTETKGKLRAKERERTAFPKSQLQKLKGRPELYPLARLVKGQPQAQQVCVAAVTLQRQLDGTWVMAFGRTRLIFPSEAHARAAEAWLRVQRKRRVSSNEFIGLKLPAEERVCYKLLDLLAEAEREIETLRTRLEEMEEELDDYVAALYGLSNEDRKVIRLFLKRF